MGARLEKASMRGMSALLADTARFIAASLASWLFAEASCFIRESMGIFVRTRAIRSASDAAAGPESSARVAGNAADIGSRSGSIPNTMYSSL